MTGDTKQCKHCNHIKPLEAFSKLTGKKSTTYRSTCKACIAYKTKEKRAGDTQVIQKGGVEVELTTDPALFRDDPEGRMPSDSDLLYWSVGYYDELLEGRKKPVNIMPKDDQ